MVELYEQDYFDGTLFRKCGEGYISYKDFPSHKARAEKLVKITRPGSVLDVGCAYGYTVKHLLNMGIPAQGCDISHWCQIKAATVIPGRFALCPAWELPYKDKEFDVIYCEGVIEHIPEDKIEAMFREFARVGERCYLQISLAGHPHSTGHITMHPPEWWFERMPDNTWLALGNKGTEENTAWLYKG